MSDWQARRFEGKTFAFTGKWWDWDVQAARDLITGDGGRVVDAVTADLDYLVVGRRPAGRKTADEKRAEQLIQNQGAAIQVIERNDFYPLFTPDRDLALALLQAGPKGVERFHKLRQFTVAPLDLSGADFRKASLSDMSFLNIILTGADLRGAELTVVQFDPLVNVNLDDAVLTGSRFVLARDCSFRNANLTAASFNPAFASINPAVWERCDFTGANLSQVNGGTSKLTDVVLRNANLQQARLGHATFSNCTFTDADLSEADLSHADLTKADLAGVNLSKANLVECQLKDADLTKADLRGVILVNADLRGARLDGADLRGANLIGAKYTSKALKKARGFDNALTAPAATAGPNLQELERIAKQCNRLQLAATVQRTDGPGVLQVWSYNQGNYLTAFLNVGSRSHHSTHKSLGDAMIDLGNHSRDGVLDLSSITTKATKSPVVGKELKALAVAAWCEAFGLETPTADTLKGARAGEQARKQTLRDEMLAELRQGALGVEKWNARNLLEKRQVGGFRQVDLSGAELQDAHLDSLDFQGANFTKANLTLAYLFGNFRNANFTGANLSGARLGQGRFPSAVFEGACLRNATLNAANLRNARFNKADLEKADLWGADLRGTDLTGANLQDARFNHAMCDDSTRWPAGFTPPDTMTWVGTGLAPWVALKMAKTPAKALNLEQFLEQLAKNTDGSKRAKALDMLKAERFQLYAQASDDHLVGVVKSQSSGHLVYSCRLNADGTYGCCTQNLNICGGLRGSLCKHLLVLIIGLAKAGKLDLARVDAWVSTSRGRRPALDRDAMSDTFLRYKGAEAGEIDWRPTETIPEDYYAL